MDIQHDTGYSVTLTSRAFMRMAEAALRPMGLGVAHAPALVALAEAGELTQREIARRTRVEQPSAAALLQRMDSAGLIEKSPDPHDRRATRIRLSAHAHVVLPEALRRLRDVDTAATAGLSAHEVEVLHDLLARVLSNLDTMIEGQNDADVS